MKTSFIVIQLLLTSFVSNANNSPNDIMGNWLMANKNVIVEVYKTDNQYFGKVIWMDKDANKKNFSVGGIIFDKMQYNPDTQKYVGGNFYGRGHKLSCELRLIEKNRIEVKVSKGILHQIRYCSRVN
jgi:uncharacterized protein (DUF2147 family)